MLFEKKPSKFNPRFEAVGCFIENNDKILLLHRKKDKPQGDSWGLPSGKIDFDEDLVEAMKREIEEETSLVVSKEDLNLFKTVYVKFENYDFVYHIFSIKLKEREDVKINNKEHSEFKWINIGEALKLNLIQDLDNCINLFYKKC